jgi:hypothetical protein
MRAEPISKGFVIGSAACCSSVATAVPKLMFVIERIQNGWCVALADAAVDAD